MIENTGFAFIDLSKDETRVASRGRVEIRRVRQLVHLGDVVGVSVRPTHLVERARF